MNLPEAVTNLFTGTCARCGLVVHLAEGVAEDYETGPVYHLGRCPQALPEPDPPEPRVVVDSGDPDVDLLAAGVDGVRADQLHAVGFRGVAAILAAAPPEIPDDATRIVIRTAEENGKTRVTDDPATARAWLAGHPLRWRPDRLRVESGPRPLHVYGDWSLWDDGRLVHGATWTAAGADTRPAALRRAAAEAVSLCVHADNAATGLDPRLWRPLCDVADLSSQTVDQHTASWSDEWEVGRSTLNLRLLRHTLTHADGGHTTLWTVNRDDSYVSTDGAGGVHHGYRIFRHGERARAEFAARARDNPAG